MSSEDLEKYCNQTIDYIRQQTTQLLWYHNQKVKRRLTFFSSSGEERVISCACSSYLVFHDGPPALATNINNTISKQLNLGVKIT